MSQCKYTESWRGQCQQQASADSDMCERHAGKKCKAHQRQAVTECAVASALVCGAPLCASPKCYCPTHGYPERHDKITPFSPCCGVPGTFHAYPDWIYTCTACGEQPEQWKHRHNRKGG